MKILFSIIMNALILFLMAFLLSGDQSLGLGKGVIVACDDCSISGIDALKTYIAGGIILGLINTFIRPVLKLVTLPLFFIFLGLVTFIVNAIILKLFGFLVNDILAIEGIQYKIDGWTNFIIAVAIFTILNMFYSLLFSKK